MGRSAAGLLVLGAWALVQGRSWSECGSEASGDFARGLVADGVTGGVGVVVVGEGAARDGMALVSSLRGVLDAVVVTVASRGGHESLEAVCHESSVHCFFGQVSRVPVESGIASVVASLDGWDLSVESGAAHAGRLRSLLHPGGR